MKQLLVLCCLFLLLSAPLFAQQERSDPPRLHIADYEMDDIRNIIVPVTSGSAMADELVDVQSRDCSNCCGMPVYYPRGVDANILIAEPSAEFYNNMPNAYGTSLKFDYRDLKRKKN